MGKNADQMPHDFNTGCQQGKLFFSFVLVVYGGLLVHMCGEKFGSGFMRLLAG